MTNRSVRLMSALFAAALFALHPADLESQRPGKLPVAFNKRLVGTINGKLAVTVNINRLDSGLVGNYYYDDKKIPIEFGEGSAISLDGAVRLVEGHYDTQTWEWIATGIFEGEFTSAHEIKGKWRNPKTGAQYEFELRESYPEGLTALEMISERQSWGDCGGRPCLETSYAYPVFKLMAGGEAESRLNKEMREKAFLRLSDMSGYDPERSYSNLAEITLDIARSYKEEKDNYPGEEAPTWASHSRVTVDFIVGDVASVNASIYQFSGGAHGSEGSILLPIDLRSGSVLHLNDILKPGAERKLKAVGEKLFRKANGIGAKEKLSDAGYSFEEGKFFLPENFYVRPDGLKFKYQQYEIAPYAMGAPELVIPYSEIRDLIRMDSPISK